MILLKQRTSNTHLHSFLIKLAAFFAIFFGNSIMSIPRRMMLQVFIGSGPEKGGLAGRRQKETVLLLPEQELESCYSHMHNVNFYVEGDCVSYDGGKRYALCQPQWNASQKITKHCGRLPRLLFSKAMAGCGLCNGPSHGCGLCNGPSHGCDLCNGPSHGCDLCNGPSHALVSHCAVSRTPHHLKGGTWVIIIYLTNSFFRSYFLGLYLFGE